MNTHTMPVERNGRAEHVDHAASHAMAPVAQPQRTPRHADATLRQETARLGMWVFLAGEVLFFGVLFVAYGVARWHSPAGFAAASAHTQLAIGTANTAVLLTSSLAMALAAEAARDGQRRCVARWLWVACALGALFMLLKGVEYTLEWRDALFPGPGFSLHDSGAELFFTWYFVVTALHALHLAIGMALAAVFAVASRRRTSQIAGAPRVHSLALYWHFVDIVWLVLYPLIYLVAPRS
jgi:cytochrome c oxidase subunit 3